MAPAAYIQFALLGRNDTYETKERVLMLGKKSRFSVEFWWWCHIQQHIVYFIGRERPTAYEIIFVTRLFVGGGDRCFLGGTKNAVKQSAGGGPRVGWLLACLGGWMDGWMDLFPSPCVQVRDAAARFSLPIVDGASLSFFLSFCAGQKEAARERKNAASFPSNDCPTYNMGQSVLSTVFQPERAEGRPFCRRLRLN